MMKTKHILTLMAASVLGCVFPTSSFGHNGFSVIAHPVTGIDVDGNLDEWPEGMTVYEPRHADYGDQPRDKDDLSIGFRIGYNASERALYVAVEVTDESTVLDPDAGQAWDTQDGCSVYIDRLHAKGVSTPVQYFRCGENLQVNGYTAEETEVVSKVVRAEGKLTYEWQLPLGEAFEPGRSLGFDLDVTDKDADGSFTWVAWTPGIRKAYFASNIGDLFLLPADAEMGSVSGRVLAQGKGEALPPVAFQSDSIPNLRVVTKVDDAGWFHIDLPEGSYTVSPVDTIARRVVESDHVHVKVLGHEASRTVNLRVSDLEKPDLAGEKGLLLAEAFDPKAIDRYVRVSMDYYMIPGVSLAVVKDGEVAYVQHYGVENAATQTPLTPDSIFEACSLTKPIFGFAVNRLVERGVIDLDVPLHTYLPNAEGYADQCSDRERYEKITARHVLAHRTGFPNWRSSNELPVQFEPGTDYGYSGEGFELLGAVVSHLTKKKLGDVVIEETFKPLELENVHLVWSETLAERVGNGHTGGMHPIPKSKVTYPGMAHSLHTNAANYAKFMTSLLERKAMAKETYAEMFRTQYERADPDDPHEFPYGLGLVSEDTAFGKKYWHGGSNPGWKCMFAVYDELKSGYVVFTNNNEGHEFAMDLEAFLITGRAPEADAK